MLNIRNFWTFKLSQYIESGHTETLCLCLPQAILPGCASQWCAGALPQKLGHWFCTQKRLLRSGSAFWSAAKTWKKIELWSCTGFMNFYLLPKHRLNCKEFEFLLCLLKPWRGQKKLAEMWQLCVFSNAYTPDCHCIHTEHTATNHQAETTKYLSYDQRDSSCNAVKIAMLLSWLSWSRMHKTQKSVSQCPKSFFTNSFFVMWDCMDQPQQQERRLLYKFDWGRQLFPPSLIVSFGSDYDLTSTRLCTARRAKFSPVSFPSLTAKKSLFDQFSLMPKAHFFQCTLIWLVARWVPLWLWPT